MESELRILYVFWFAIAKVWDYLGYLYSLKMIEKKDWATIMKDQSECLKT